VDRRQFLVVTGQGAGVIGLASLSGCSSLFEGEAAAGGANVAHVAGSQHQVFVSGGGPGENGSAFVIDPLDHQVHDLGGDGSSSVLDASVHRGLGELNSPIDAQMDTDGRLYVLDHGNHQIRIYDPQGQAIGTIGGNGDLHLPQDMQVHEGRIYVCDTLTHQIDVFDTDGNLVSTIGEFGIDGGKELNGPVSITVGNDGNLHVLEVGNGEVQVFTTGGEPVRQYGGVGEIGDMVRPRSVVALGDGRICVGDPSGGLVHVFTEGGDYLGAFKPLDPSGKPTVPVRLSLMPDGGLYVWNNGFESFDA